MFNTRFSYISPAAQILSRKMLMGGRVNRCDEMTRLSTSLAVTTPGCCRERVWRNLWIGLCGLEGIGGIFEILERDYLLKR